MLLIWGDLGWIHLVRSVPIEIIEEELLCKSNCETRTVKDSL
jgi:hypothetical protein